jgi:TPR repeat protein
VQGDPAKARAWYARAAEQGSLEAKQRLQALR